MRLPRQRRVLLALVLVAAMLAPLTQLARSVTAQDATPVATPLPGARTWHVLVNNVSPMGENWSFNAFYPDRIAAHPGDTIVFTLAPNPQAFHTVHILALGMTPLEWYSGFSGGFLQPDLIRSGATESPFFDNEAWTACGRAGQDPCQYVDTPGDISFGLNSGVLVNPPPDGAGNTSFAVTLDPSLRLGPYYFMSDVDGPTMQGRIDLVAPDQPVQSADDLAAAAERQFEADLAWLGGSDRIAYPAEASNPDATKTWQAAAGVGSPDKPWLSINEFAPAQMVVIAGDTVTWTNHSRGVVPHTVTGFASSPDAIPRTLNPYLPGCLGSDGELTLPPPGSFPPDIWNTCPGAEVNNLTEFSLPSAPSGAPYEDGERTSGILLNEEYRQSPVGDGLPFESSYSVTFPEPGTYYYACAIHPGMTGAVVVLPQPMPR